MLLSGKCIGQAIESAALHIRPFSSNRVRGASYVLSLGSRFRRWRGLDEPIQLWSPDAACAHLADSFDAEQLIIQPHEFILASSAELIGIGFENFAVVSPLSHVARFGLGLHCGADFINPGFGIENPSKLTLELFNHNSSPLVLNAGMPIAHLRIGVVQRSVRTTNQRTHTSIYEGSDPVCQPMFFEEWSTLMTGDKYE